VLGEGGARSHAGPNATAFWLRAKTVRVAQRRCLWGAMAINRTHESAMVPMVTMVLVGPWCPWC
jgi:hypothetical protein